MKNLKKILGYSLISFCLLLIVNNSVTAHYVWLETELESEKKDTISISSFWGHLQDNTADLTTTDLKQYIQSPNGIIREIHYTDQGNYLSSQTTLNSAGIYQIYNIRPADVYQRSLNQYTAKSYLNIKGPKKSQSWNQAVGLPLEIILHTNPFNLTAQTEIKVEVRYLGQALANTEINLISRDDTTKDISNTTDYNGQTTLKLNTKGDYLLTTNYEIAKTGTHNSRDYDKISHTHVIFLKVD